MNTIMIALHVTIAYEGVQFSKFLYDFTFQNTHHALGSNFDDVINYDKYCENL